MVLEADPALQTDPRCSDRIYVGAANGSAGAAAQRGRGSRRGTAPLAVRHQGQFPAATISFNLPPGVALGDALARGAAGDASTCACRTRVRTEFAGNAQLPDRQPEFAAVADRRRVPGDLHRARRAVRKPDAAADDHLHLPSAGLGRVAGAAGDRAPSCRSWRSSASCC